MTSGAGQVRPALRLDPGGAAVARSPRWRLAYLLIVLLGLAPVVVVIAERHLLLMPLLLLPVATVDLAWRHAVQAEREHKLAQREQARAKATAEAMLATVSHELRAPLTVVLGSLETLGRRDQTLPADDRRELVAMAVYQGRRLQRLVEQLLLAARVEHGALEQGPMEPGGRPVVDAVAVMREACAATELCHPGRRVRLESRGILPVRAYPRASVSASSSASASSTRAPASGRAASASACTSPASSPEPRAATSSWPTPAPAFRAPASSCGCRRPKRMGRESVMQRASSGNNRMNLAAGAPEG